MPKKRCQSFMFLSNIAYLFLICQRYFAENCRLHPWSECNWNVVTQVWWKCTTKLKYFQWQENSFKLVSVEVPTNCETCYFSVIINQKKKFQNAQNERIKTQKNRINWFPVKERVNKCFVMSTNVL